MNNAYTEEELARAVAAAHQAVRLEAHNLHKSVTFKAMAQRDDALSATKPVAGELPPLPADSLIGILYDAAETRYGVTEYMGWCRRAADALKAIEGWCKARPAQPVQQPAAVVGQEPKRLDCPECGDGYRHALTCKFSAPASAGVWRCRDCMGRMGENHSDFCGIGSGRITETDVGDLPIPERTAPVPAAETKMTYDQIFQRGRLSAIEDYKNVVVPAAGVQGDTNRAGFEKHIADSHPSACLDRHPNLHHLYALSWVNEAWLAWRKATVQPDSGRDAALEVLEGYADNYDAMARISKGGTVDYTAVAHDIRRNMVDGVRAALAAHPANGAQAGLSDAEIAKITAPFVGNAEARTSRNIGACRAILAAAKKGG